MFFPERITSVDASMDEDFHNVEEVRRTLVRIAEGTWTAWHGSGHPMSPAATRDADTIIDSMLGRFGVAGFFDGQPLPYPSWRLLNLKDLVPPFNPESARLELLEINQQVLARLAANPQLLRHLNPRKFEEVVAEIFVRMGFSVELTPRSRDGGADLIAVEKRDFGTMITLVECNRFSPDHKVGVALVRSLYGVLERHRASHAVLATTSSFTRGARDFQQHFTFRMSLRDFDDLAAWCAKYGQGR